MSEQTEIELELWNGLPEEQREDLHKHSFVVGVALAMMEIQSITENSLKDQLSQAKAREAELVGELKKAGHYALAINDELCTPDLCEVTRKRIGELLLNIISLKYKEQALGGIDE